MISFCSDFYLNCKGTKKLSNSKADCRFLALRTQKTRGLFAEGGKPVAG